jgi:3'-phosphoadenosine 5'-phosphosulfate sulfotransferase (PAPS reductase)/FAD synthetase
MIVSWFSAGVSSAVATKLAIAKIDKILYTHIEDQHPDTLRFVKDCETWFGKPIEILQSPLKTVENACLAAGGKGYINGIGGAACTRLLKRKVRKQWEYEQPVDEKLTYIWGMDYNESDRCYRLQDSMPEQDHVFPLVEQQVSKEQAHKILTASNIKRPAMYDIGYSNNNCVGCVKGGKGY